LVKRNQPSLRAQLAALPWRDVPVAYDKRERVAYDKRERGHGRTERRTLKVTSVANGLWLSPMPCRPSRSCAAAS
jgi:hypothetical protein